MITMNSSQCLPRSCAMYGKNAFMIVIGGFHVTQVSFITTQLKNKIAYH